MTAIYFGLQKGRVRNKFPPGNQHLRKDYPNTEGERKNQGESLRLLISQPNKTVNPIRKQSITQEEGHREIERTDDWRG